MSWFSSIKNRFSRTNVPSNMNGSQPKRSLFSRTFNQSGLKTSSYAPGSWAVPIYVVYLGITPTVEVPGDTSTHVRITPENYTGLKAIQGWHGFYMYFPNLLDPAGIMYDDEIRYHHADKLTNGGEGFLNVKTNIMKLRACQTPDTCNANVKWVFEESLYNLINGDLTYLVTNYFKQPKLTALQQKYGMGYAEYAILNLPNIVRTKPQILNKLTPEHKAEIISKFPTVEKLLPQLQQLQQQQQYGGKSRKLKHNKNKHNNKKHRKTYRK